MKILFRTLIGILAIAVLLEMPSAYAIFGIRAARTAIAARKARQMTSSPDADKAYAEEQAKFSGRTEAGKAPEANVPNTNQG